MITKILDLTLVVRNYKTGLFIKVVKGEKWFQFRWFRLYTDILVLCVLWLCLHFMQFVSMCITKKHEPISKNYIENKKQ